MKLFKLSLTFLIINFTYAQTPTYKQEETLNNLMNQWHRNIANTKTDDVFSFMAKDFYYLGTDPEECWSKEEFYTFCKPYFKKGKAWDFKPLYRKWNFTNRRTAFFYERLDTWMGECRGSGVLIKRMGKWQLTQYNLAITIKNKDMNEVKNINKN